MKKKQIEGLLFTLYITIFVLKSFSFQLLLSLVRYDFRLYFVSVLLNISVSIFVSVNEYITAALCYSASRGHEYWIGLYKSAPARTDNCYWLDGNPSTFRKWDDGIGEPNSNDMCIRMYTNGEYRDIACSAQHRYVCKVHEGISYSFVIYLHVNKTKRTF